MKEIRITGIDQTRPTGTASKVADDGELPATARIYQASANTADGQIARGWAILDLINKSRGRRRWALRALIALPAMAMLLYLGASLWASIKALR